MAIAKYIVAGLGAAASVSAVPYASSSSKASYYSSATSTLSTVYGTSTPSTGYSNSSTISYEPSTATGAPVPVLAAADAATIGKAAASELTNVRKFNQLLTVGGMGTELLAGEELRQRTVFDFNQANNTGEGGRVLGATVGNFPLLLDSGLSTTVGFLEPCSMNSPHTHPRANEWYTVVEGNIRTGFMLENGFLANAKDGGRLTTEVDTQLGKFQGTLFPMGSIHYQFNDQCSPATFVATLSNEDPGTSQIAQNFFFQDDVVVDVVLGEIQNINGQNIEEFRATLPPNLVQAVDTCLAKCK